jgi:manganese efflux pump family protein
VIARPLGFPGGLLLKEKVFLKEKMELVTSLFVGVGLAMDAFAVSLSIGTDTITNDMRAKLRLAFHFGFFQMMMTVLGWLAGNTISTFIQDFDHWVAFGLLAYVGINMIRSGLNPNFESYRQNPSRGRLLVVLCIATSIDALAVGLSMAMIHVWVYFPSIVIGLVTFGLSMVGLKAGGKLGQKFGKRMEIYGGIILIGIGLKILAEHLL